MKIDILAISISPVNQNIWLYNISVIKEIKVNIFLYTHFFISSI